MNKIKKHLEFFKKKDSENKIEGKIKIKVIKDTPKEETIELTKDIKEKKKYNFPTINFSREKFKVNLGKDNLLLEPRFSIKKQTFFAKKLSFLIKAGMPVLESMHTIREQSHSKSEKKVFDKIVKDIANGQSLATSLSKFKGVFGNFAINIIKSGEQSGNLTDNLSYLADELKKKQVLKKKIMGALLYPAIITIATLGITGLLTLYIFPKIMPIFESLKADLPFSTRAIIFFTDTLKNYGLYILFGLIVLVIAWIILLKKSPKIRFFYDGFILKIPIFGSLIRDYNVTNVTRTLGLLLRSGISVNEALNITSSTTENVRYRQALHNISLGVMKGKSISELTKHYSKLFPLMMSHMIAIGEKSGNLSNTLTYLSEFYEKEFDDTTKNLSSSIEPVLMIVMGIIVSFVAISVITPIYEITNHLKR